MDINQIRTQLSSAKSSAKKGDLAGSLKRFIYAMHALVQSNAPVPTELKSLIRDTTMEYNAFTQVKDSLNISFSYTAGEEKKLLVTCMKAYEHLTKNQKDEESYEAALKRKKALDTYLNSAKDFLSRDFIEQADAAIEKALENYKDEHAVFAYIGELYLQKNYTTRAKHFYKRATEADPSNQAAAKKLIEISKMQPR